MSQDDTHPPAPSFVVARTALSEDHRHHTNTAHTMRGLINSLIIKGGALVFEAAAHQGSDGLIYRVWQEGGAWHFERLQPRSNDKGSDPLPPYEIMPTDAPERLLLNSRGDPIGVGLDGKESLHVTFVRASRLEPEATWTWTQHGPSTSSPADPRWLTAEQMRLAESRARDCAGVAQRLQDQWVAVASAIQGIAEHQGSNRRPEADAEQDALAVCRHLGYSLDEFFREHPPTQCLPRFSHALSELITLLALGQRRNIP